MNNVTSLIIDDEQIARFNLRHKLADFPNIEIVGEARSFEDAVEKINYLKPQLIFLDIQLSDGNGFDLLDKVEYSGKIIFVTAFDGYAIRAFEINAVDYLLKPISKKRLGIAIEKLYKDKRNDTEEINVKLNHNDRLMVTHKNSVNFIKVNNITSIIASRAYSSINTLDGREYLTSKSMGEWENRLPDHNFCRIHRSTIINFDHIIKIDYKFTGTSEVLIQGHSEPLVISRNYFRKLKERYSL